MAYNYSELKGRIIARFGTMEAFTKELGLSAHSVSVKINNKVDWKQSEINRACELLDIREDQIGKYFFTQVVQSA